MHTLYIRDPSVKLRVYYFDSALHFAISKVSLPTTSSQNLCFDDYFMVGMGDLEFVTSLSQAFNISGYRKRLRIDPMIFKKRLALIFMQMQVSLDDVLISRCPQNGHLVILVEG